MFGKEKKEWEDLKGILTANEIFQQPVLWNKTFKTIRQQKEKINDFLESNYNKKGLKVIFTGAGTSAYVGEIASSYLNESEISNFNAIATTDIVSNPKLHLKKDTPTLIVSFARSGNSPESLAVYDLANQLVDDVCHIFITCNEKGKLAQISKGKDDILLLLMPEESNDKGFAMTSSFSCMTLAAILIFDINNLEENERQLNRAIKAVKDILENKYKEVDNIIKESFTKIVYLGSGCFYGLAKESALKILELTRGKIITLSESVLGFRHGPKSIVDDTTVVVVYISKNPYARKYDLDILKELYNNAGEHAVVAIATDYSKEVEENSDKFIYLVENEISNAGFIALIYGIFAQLLALKASIKLNIQPDNPNPSGLVNRVVKGVTIYKY